MKKILFISCILHFLSLTTFSQGFSSPAGARSAGRGHTAITMEDFWSVFNNQAAAASLKHTHAGLYLENRYMLPDMNRVALGIFIPVRKGGFSFNIDHFGGSLYSEMKSGISYSMPVGEHFAAGVQLDYLRMTIGEGYGNYHSVTFEAGMLADITEKLSLGLHLFNPVHSKWINTKEHIPVIVKGGISYRPENILRLYAEAHKSSDMPAIFCAGAEYNYSDRFFLRAGITSGPSRYTFGVGLKLNRLMLDFASSIHAWLGYSPQVSFTYKFEK